MDPCEWLQMEKDNLSLLNVVRRKERGNRKRKRGVNSNRGPISMLVYAEWF